MATFGQQVITKDYAAITTIVNQEPNDTQSMRTDKTINRLIEEFLSETISNERSRTNYRSTLNRFFRYLSGANRNVRKVTKTDVMEYKQQLVNENKSAHTIDNYLASVRQFFAWLDAKDYHDNVAAGVRSPRRSRLFRKKYLTVEQVKMLLNAIPRNTINGLRDYAIISLMLRTGVRCVEVERANIGDITNHDDILAINIQRKGRVEKEERIGLTGKTIDAINDYLVQRIATDDKPLFVNHSSRANSQRIQSTNINRIVKRYMQSVGLTGKRYSAHSLRHTAAITALIRGVDIYEVKAMLGHTSVSTTEIYTHMIDEYKRLINTPGKVLDEVY